MRSIATVPFLMAAAILPGIPELANADYTCQEGSNVCSYAVQTSAPAVDLWGGGHTADRREWIVAPAEKYFVNASVATQGYTGRNVHCEIGASDGVQQRSVRVGDAMVTVTFAKKYLVVAHAETGSGPTNISHTAMMICNFTAQLAPLP